MSLADADLLSAGPILLYDGSCGVCSRVVQWILRHERTTELRFAPLESELGIRLREHAKVPLSIDSLVWLEMDNGQLRALLRSSAALRVADYVGGGWRLLSVFRLLPPGLRDWAYSAFAKIRHQVAAPSCLVPTKEERQRFLGVF